MADYKIPWNYEPGVNSVNISLNFGTGGSGYPVLTNYYSKYSDYYLYNRSSDALVFSQYTWSVNVTRANNPSVTVTLDEPEQLEVTSVENNKYKVTYPGIAKTFDMNVYVAKPSSYYQLVKETLANSSSWVDTSSWSNDVISISKYQCPKYFVPINTNINLNEEFKLRWIGYSTTISGLSYSLPSTYYVENTIDNFSYTTFTSIAGFDTNPKVTYNGDNVLPLSRSNGDWIMNIPNTGTYTLTAAYTRDPTTLKPTMGEDIGYNSSADNRFNWSTIIEAYDPSVTKVLSTDLYTYKQQGYDWLQGGLQSGWALHDDEGVLEDLEITSSSNPNYAYLSFRNNVTPQSIGLDAFSNRGISKLRDVKLHLIMKFFSPSASASTYKICFSTTNITGSTDQSLGETVEIGYSETSKTITRNVDLLFSGNPITGSANYITGLYMWHDNQWEPAGYFEVVDSALAFEYATTVSGWNDLPWFSTSSQIWYY